MDNAQIRTQLTASFLAVYGCAGDGNMIAAYVQVLGDIPVEVLRAAYDKVLLECEHRPVPAVVYKAAKGLVEQNSGTGKLTWAEAWQEIEEQMRINGLYAEPVFSRPEITEAVKAFGWRNLCETLTKDMGIVRSQLKNMYLEICERQENAKMNSYILGKNKLLDSKINLIGMKKP